MAVVNFNQNPQITPIPPSGAWIYPMGGNAANALNVTTTNSSTAVTVNSPGTSMLAIGQTITGLNIAPNTTIAALPTSSSLTLSQNTLSSGAATGNVTVAGYPNVQSSFGNYQFAGVPSLAALAADVLGCPFAIPESQSLLANATFIPAYGSGNIALTSGTTAMTVQIQTAAGTWTTIFTGTASTTSWVIGINLDYGNVRINCPTTAGSFVFYRYRAEPIF